MSSRPWSVAPVTVLALCALAVGPAPAWGQSLEPRATERPWPPVATFSILGYDSATGEVGVAVQSRVFSVGNGVIWGEAGAGVVATQAIVDVSYGPQALELLRQGLSPAQVVERVLENDPDPRPDRWTKCSSSRRTEACG